VAALGGPWREIGGAPMTNERQIADVVNAPADGPEPAFSLVAGGALFRIWRRVGLVDAGMSRAVPRALVMALLAWIPLLVIAMLEGRAMADTVFLPFLGDFDIHAKLLAAIPLLILAENTADRRLSPIVKQFVVQGLIDTKDRPKFDRALASAGRLRDSTWAEAGILAFVFAIGVATVWYNYSALDVESWYFSPGAEGSGLTLAGWIAACVSLPIFQFLLLRWYYRLFIWGRLLRHLARLDLRLNPIHPDSTAGLGFLSLSTSGFLILLLAQGAVLSGTVADRIFFEGSRLLDFKPELLGIVTMMVLIVAGPLLFFSSRLRAARRVAMLEFATLGQRYADGFDGKWLRGQTQTADVLLGNPDFQSLADLQNGYAVAAKMNTAPLSASSIMNLVVATLLPVAPLLLTTFSVEELITRVLGALL
jgi:hypothetical protein